MRKCEGAAEGVRGWDFDQDPGTGEAGVELCEQRVERKHGRGPEQADHATSHTGGIL